MRDWGWAGGRGGLSSLFFFLSDEAQDSFKQAMHPRPITDFWSSASYLSDVRITGVSLRCWDHRCVSGLTGVSLRCWDHRCVSGVPGVYLGSQVYVRGSQVFLGSQVCIWDPRCLSQVLESQVCIWGHRCISGTMGVYLGSQLCITKPGLAVLGPCAG